MKKMNKKIFSSSMAVLWGIVFTNAMQNTLIEGYKLEKQAVEELSDVRSEYRL